MRIATLAVVFTLVGCGAQPIVSEPRPPIDSCLDAVCVHTQATTRVDVLFVLDDGPTMADKLTSFRAALPSLLDSFTKVETDVGVPISFHLGAITADLGAGPTAVPSFHCVSGGDRGALRASAGMMGGVRYVDLDDITRTANVPDVAAALAAITDVGTGGCAFQQPLEAAYRALHDNLPENAGFLRADAALVVVFVSDEDDCSTPPDTDLFDGSAAGVAAYGPLTRFRCTQFGIECNGQPLPAMSLSGLTGCTSYDLSNGGKLTDLDTYIHFFTQPASQGGVKVDPSDVMLAAIAAPSDPVGVSVTSPCAADPSTSMCAALDPSCVSPTDASDAGLPAVRLLQVVNGARNARAQSICGGDDGQFLGSLLEIPIERHLNGCFTRPIAFRADGTADCIVDDATTNPDGTTTTVAIPACADDGGARPCWDLVDRLPQYDAGGCTPPTVTPPATCMLPAECQPVGSAGTRQLYSLTVERDTPLPPGTGTTVTCAEP